MTYFEPVIPASYRVPMPMPMPGRSPLLLGGLTIGWVAGPEGIAPLDRVFFDLFKGLRQLLDGAYVADVDVLRPEKF